MLVAAGCGASSLEEPAALEVKSEASLLESGEGASRTVQGTNGLGHNGLGTNGLGTNGLGTNGLSTNTMNGTAFVDWFNKDPALADVVMRYVVACAVKAGASFTWTNPLTGSTYTWSGSLGLTPNWAGGTPATEVEQQVITACLAAHTNKYGILVPFSVQGLDASGKPIPVTSGEFTTFSEREACFFGNLFNGEGVFAGNDAGWPSSHSSVRACGLESSKTKDQCLPIQHLSRCEYLCVPDALRNYYVSCSYKGKNYRAMTTRIRSQDVYRCGDGVCQFSESCGTGNVPDDCKDCGPCS